MIKVVILNKFQFFVWKVSNLKFFTIARFFCRFSRNGDLRRVGNIKKSVFHVTIVLILVQKFLFERDRSLQ